MPVLSHPRVPTVPRRRLIVTTGLVAVAILLIAGYTALRQP